MASVESLLAVLIEEVQGLRSDLEAITKPTFPTTLDEVNDSVQAVQSALKGEVDRLMGAGHGNLGCSLTDLQSHLISIEDNTSR